MPSFGEGLGTVIGSSLAADDLAYGQHSVDNNADAFKTETQPYNQFGQSFLNPASSAIGGVQAAAGETKSYDQFMKDYTTSPGVKYQLDQAREGQNLSAASTGQLLSGTNLRALDTISQGIASTGANTAYDEYLKGNNQQFGQLETSLGNMFKAIGVGTTATGQDASVVNSQNSATSSIAQAQAKNDQSKGSGIGSMFSGLGGLAAAF